MAARRLNAEQEALLDTVQQRHIQRVNARMTLETQAKAWVRERMAEVEKAESMAVRAALAAGVPRQRVGLEGLGSKDYHTVTRVLAVTDDMIAAEAEQIAVLSGTAGHQRYVRLATEEERSDLEWPVGEFLARVDWPRFETDEGAVVDLHGFVIVPRGTRWPYAAVWEDGEGLQPSGPLAAAAGRESRLNAQLDRLRNES